MCYHLHRVHILNHHSHRGATAPTYTSTLKELECGSLNSCLINGFRALGYAMVWITAIKTRVNAVFLRNIQFLDMFNASNISFASLHSFLIPPRRDESWSEVRLQSCLCCSPTSIWLKVYLKMVTEHFVSPSRSWTVCSHGRADTLASLSATATICSVTTQISLFRTLAMPSLAKISKNPWRVVTTVLLMVNTSLSAISMYVTPPCS